METASAKLAKILRTKPEILDNLAIRMEKITGKSGIMEKIVQENEILVGRTLDELGLPIQERTAERVYEVLIKRLEHMDEHLYNFLDKPDLAELSNACGKLCEVAEQLAENKRGFFIKKEKAVELLEKYPPKNLLDHFGYTTVRELVDKRGFSSVFASLRFAQDEKWMHSFFDEAYKGLTTNDFEERTVELKVLEQEWLAVADKFMKHKYHNVSHLKELGIIFIVPIKIDTPGETSRMFTLLLHYLNEVPFYSKLFRKFAEGPNFISKLQSLLRGDVPEETVDNSNGKLRIRIVQRYLAKDDANDFRLLEPHVNPEAEHWYRAESDLGRMATMPGTTVEGNAFGYWHGLDFVGEYCTSANGSEEFISFNVIDLIMSLVSSGKAGLYYHQQEALWNKIFVEYLGRDRMNQLIEENIIGGFITL